MIVAYREVSNVSCMIMRNIKSDDKSIKRTKTKWECESKIKLAKRKKRKGKNDIIHVY